MSYILCNNDNERSVGVGGQQLHHDMLYSHFDDTYIRITVDVEKSNGGGDNVAR